MDEAPAPAPDPNLDLPPADDDDYDDSWARIFQILLQYNGEEPNDRIPNGFVVDRACWSLISKPPPFPINLESTWYLAACLVVILAVHLELDTSWMLENGWWHCLGRIFYGVFMTIAIALLNTVMYDCFGGSIEFTRRRINTFIRDAMNAHWDGWINAIWPHQFLSSQVYVLAARLFFLYLDWYLTGFLSIFWSLGMGIFGFATERADILRFLFSDDFLARYWSFTVIPAPGSDNSSILAALAWEVLPQVTLLVTTASLLYLLVMFCEVKTQESLIYGEVRKSPFWYVFFVLFRATAIHIMACTAYQLLHLSLGIIKTTYFQGWLDWPLSWNYQIQISGRTLVHGRTFAAIGHSILAALILYIAQLIVAIWCQMLTIISWRFWRPYFAWMTLFLEPSIEAWWPQFKEMVMYDTEQLYFCYYPRALMTLLFGAKSSWPIRTAFDAVP